MLWEFYVETWKLYMISQVNCHICIDCPIMYMSFSCVTTIQFIFCNCYHNSHFIIVIIYCTHALNNWIAITGGPCEVCSYPPKNMAYMWDWEISELLSRLQRPLPLSPWTGGLMDCGAGLLVEASQWFYGTFPLCEHGWFLELVLFECIPHLLWGMEEVTRPLIGNISYYQICFFMFQHC